MSSDILCGVLTFSTRLDPRLIADQLVSDGMEFVAVYRNDNAETIALFSLADGVADRRSASRFMAKQRLAFGPDLIRASAAPSISRTIRIPD